MRERFKKILTSILIVGLLLTQGPTAYAFDFPTPPPAPTAPPAPTSAPTSPPAPTPPPAPWDPTPTPTPEPTEEPSQEQSTTEGVGSSESPPPTSTSNGSTSQITGESADGTVGGASIDTGDAANTGAIVTNVNTNSSATIGGDSPSGVGVINNSNGSDSVNSGSAAIVENNNTFQNNSATVGSDLNQSTTTGDNSASKNVGDSTITTGDANTSGTVITAVNTNVDGIMVAEFNVVDDHMGDIILDFSSGCISGCTGGDVLAKNSGNGSESTNTAGIDSLVNNNTFQTNDASVENNMTLVSDSGNNLTDNNTGGNSTIETGDANVAASALTFANNNLAGGVIYAVVNIFGDLIGNIILPEGALTPCCLGSASAANTGNGSGSTNDASINQSTNDTTYQFNNVDLTNNLILDTTSGGNDVNANTGGNSEITTGDTSIMAQVLNVANNNIVGGNFWLVIVNEAGRWIGRILGSPDGQNFGGSSDFEFLVNEFGEITVVNSGNGSGSTNTGTVDSTVSNTTVQTNTANIVNNLDLSANTGGNSASKNTGGDSIIKTGDANIIANIVNFVNNNITGTGRLFVTVVNVFGSWLGNFVGPGFEAESESSSDPGVGGAEVTTQSASQESQSSAGSQGSSTSTGQTSEAAKPPRVAGIFSINSGSDSGASQIAGISIPLPGAETAGDKKININLAWILVVLFPAGVISMIIRRRAFILKLIRRK